MTIDELWISYKENNDANAKDQLIVHYVELVKIICGRLYNSYNGKVEYDDLVGYGVIGLIDAIGKFDHKKQVKFETYANIRIRGAIVDQIRAMDWIPRSMRQKFKNLEKAYETLSSKHGVDISDELLAETMDMSVSEVRKLLGEVTTFSVSSLDEKLIETPNFGVSTEDESTLPEESFFNEDAVNFLADNIDHLKDNERMVISLYYYEELTYKEIATIMGISESRISQIHSKAIIKLRGSVKDYYEKV